MKFSFNMAIKGLPTADVKCEFECSADELTVLISDPVYQKLGQKLVEEVSFAPKAQPEKPEVNPDIGAIAEELCERVNCMLKSFRKEMEADKKVRDTQLKIMHNEADRVCKLVERNKF